MRGTGFAWGSCGELVQGVLPDGTEFQVTCPIDRGTRVDVDLRPAEVASVTGLLPKAAHAAELAMESVGIGPCEVTAQRVSCLPIGVGMGSSTADVVATARAVAAAAGARLSPDELADIAGSIEPSDGAMYDGIVVKHRRGRLMRTWAWTPRFDIVVVHAMGGVGTDSVDFADAGRYADEYAHLLAALDQAVAARDSAPFALAATHSARLNQCRLFNPHLSRLAGEGALGLTVAHTGTVLGLLFPPGSNPALRSTAARLRAELRLPTSLARTP